MWGFPRGFPNVIKLLSILNPPILYTSNVKELVFIIPFSLLFYFYYSFYFLLLLFLLFFIIILFYYSLFIIPNQSEDRPVF